MMRYEVLPYENIRSLRVDVCMTQQQVAEYLNVKQNTYSQYEIGVLNYPIDVLCRLADLYQVSVDYLLGRTDEKNAVSQENNDTPHGTGKHISPPEPPPQIKKSPVPPCGTGLLSYRFTFFFFWRPRSAAPPRR